MKKILLIILSLFLFSCFEVEGCTDKSACNYNDEATQDDGTCDYGDFCWDGSQQCECND